MEDLTEQERWEKVRYYVQKAVQSFLDTDELLMKLCSPKAETDRIMDIIGQMRFPVLLSKELRNGATDAIVIRRIQH